MELYYFLAILLVFVILSAFSSYSSFDKGAAGERRICKHLRRFEKKEGGKILTNIYVPKSTGGTTEIDILLIHPKGLFVLESKNYSGWIFGNDRHKTWTQTLPKGWHGDVHKERFYNPVLQNASHIEHLMHHITKNIPVWSIVVFSDACEFKDITVSRGNVRVVHSYHVSSVISNICEETPIVSLSEDDILNLYNRLLPCVNVSEDVKQQRAQKAIEAKQRL